MKMNLLNGCTMDQTFCLGNPVVDRADILFHGIGGVNVGNPVFYFRHAAVVMLVMVMGMVVMWVLVFLGIPHINMDVGALNAALLGQLPLKFHAGDTQLVQLVHHCLRIWKQLQQSGGEHVSGGAHAAV